MSSALFLFSKSGYGFILLNLNQFWFNNVFPFPSPVLALISKVPVDFLTTEAFRNGGSPAVL